MDSSSDEDVQVGDDVIEHYTEVDEFAATVELLETNEYAEEIDAQVLDSINEACIIV